MDFTAVKYTYVGAVDSYGTYPNDLARGRKPWRLCGVEHCDMRPHRKRPQVGRDPGLTQHRPARRMCRPSLSARFILSVMLSRRAGPHESVCPAVGRPPVCGSGRAVAC